MARSSHIYVVFWRDSSSLTSLKYGKLYSAFTVKHEMESAIQHNPNQYRVVRIRDGEHGGEQTQLQ